MALCTSSAKDAAGHHHVLHSGGPLRIAVVPPSGTPILCRTILTSVRALSTDFAPRHTTLPDGYTFTV